MASSAIKTPAFQAKAGNIQNEDGSSIYSNGDWSLKNSTAVASVTIKDDGKVGIGTDSPATNLDITGVNPIIRISDTQEYSAGSWFDDTPLGGLEFYTKDVSGIGPHIGAFVNAVTANTVGGQTTPSYALSFGTGAVNTPATERMRIDASGRLMVGATSSAYIFRANGFSHFGDAYDTGQYGAIQISRPQATSNKFHLACISSGLQVCGLGFLNNSNVFAVNNAASSNTNGVSLATNATAWSPLLSDERKKKNFETTQGLAEVLQIEPVKYHLLDDEDMQPKRLGFKAQNLQPLIPEMVIPNGQKAEDGSDYLTITPDYLLPVLVKALQELSAKNDALEARLAALEAK